MHSFSSFWQVIMILPCYIIVFTYFASFTGYEDDISEVIFKASALWAYAFYKSKCPYVCLSVCVWSLLRYRLTVFLTPLLEDIFEFYMLVDFFCFQKNGVSGYSWSTLLWYWCYYPHLSRDALSPVCGIFLKFLNIFVNLPIKF